jgi:serine/threonine protein kinase
MENMHKRGVVHCDIKPDNLLLGAENNPHEKDHAHLVDFGLAHDSEDPPQYDNLKGSLTWMAIWTMRSHDHRPVTDLESLAYALIYLVCGRLPWEGIYDPDVVLKLKKETPADGYCGGLPDVFSQFLARAKSAPLDGVPNYDPFHKMFRDEWLHLQGQPAVYAERYKQHPEGGASPSVRWIQVNSELLPVKSPHKALEGQPYSVAAVTAII